MHTKDPIGGFECARRHTIAISEYSEHVDSKLELMLVPFA